MNERCPPRRSPTSTWRSSCRRTKRERATYRGLDRFSRSSVRSSWGGQARRCPLQRRRAPARRAGIRVVRDLSGLRPPPRPQPAYSEGPYLLDRRRTLELALARERGLQAGAVSAALNGADESVRQDDVLQGSSPPTSNSRSGGASAFDACQAPNVASRRLTLREARRRASANLGGLLEDGVQPSSRATVLERAPRRLPEEETAILHRPRPERLDPRAARGAPPGGLRSVRPAFELCCIVHHLKRPTQPLATCSTLLRGATR